MSKFYRMGKKQKIQLEKEGPKISFHEYLKSKQQPWNQKQHTCLGGKIPIRIRNNKAKQKMVSKSRLVLTTVLELEQKWEQYGNKKKKRMGNY